jgi:hypothetical protein
MNAALLTCSHARNEFLRVALAIEPRLRRMGSQPFPETKKKDHTLHGLFSLAGDEGFEPPIVEPESTALPLGQSPLTD